MSIVQLIALPILTIAWASASFGYAAATAANVNPANGRAYGPVTSRAHVAPPTR